MELANIIGILVVVFFVWKYFIADANPKKEGDLSVNKQSELESTVKTPTNIQGIAHNRQTHLCTKNEQKLYFSLHKALDQSYQIHCQVSLISLVEPVEQTQKKRAYSKRVDFVITDTASKILLVIELDDSTHLRKDRIKRDEYVNHALNGAHPFLRIKTQNFYEPKNIAERLSAISTIKNKFLESSGGNEVEALVGGDIKIPKD